ncbi:ABC transporter substrate-binding protein [Rhodococcus tibetensis]|uniref:Iron-siderophore ABC transporter substrate-binding protein n=1 Tax=Rhodococcus tibetensis TaxID=2965064 RepID=A0ABT1QBM9_9NOCA|nr:iron-siderophore ABC transporter substrate-binding protein [Rhodococcus sp. FXJ9.536]MCQ4119673.1 iron-siderophore ABC transporter substrate-binding protein [Rhodococcus sp. FXJ9.536]
MRAATCSPEVTDAQWQELVAALTRRQFGVGLGAAALAALTAACAGGEADSGTDAEGRRTITHAMGTTVVGGHPTRIVALDSLPIDTVVSLGKTPVGAAQAGSADGLPAYLGAGLVDTAVVGSIAEPSLEAIAALRPDLILSSKQRHGELYESLAAIAPTVFAASPAVDWQATITLFAEAMGEQDTAAQKLAAFHSRAAAVRARLGAGGRTAHIIRVMDNGLRLHGPGTFAGSVLTEAGFTITGQPWDAKNNMSEISLEHVNQVDSDIAFVANTLAPGQLGIAGELVAQMGASRRGGVHQTNYRTWITGIGLGGANLILDDL